MNKVTPLLDEANVSASTKAPVGTSRQNKILRAIRRYGGDYLFITPYLVHFLVFFVFPIAFLVTISLTDWNLTKPTSRFIGLNNYRDLFFQDELFIKSLFQTLYFVVYRVAGVAIFGLGGAMLLNQTLRGIGFFRTVFYFPVVVDWVIVSIVWLFLLEPSIGLINQFLIVRGYHPQPFFNSPNQAMPIIIVMSIWKDVAYYAIIYLAALQDFPPTLREAAQLDGANRWQIFRYVTFPWLAPITLVVIILASINSLRVFNQIYVTTQGGPLNSTTSIMYYLYNVAFRYLQVGYGSAISLIFFVIVLLFVLLQRRVLGSFGRTS